MKKHITPARDNLYPALLERILTGALAAGARVNESRLAAELGISRTPLRETLFRLERNGFLYTDLARGFFVTPLTRREASEIYPVISTLESLALRSSGMLSSLRLPLLRQINRQLEEAAESPEQALLLDTKWHRTLLEGCDNQHLLFLIEGQRAIIERYERLYMRETALIRVSTTQHQHIIDALEQGDTELAVKGLETNWRMGLQTLLVQLTDAS